MIASSSDLHANRLLRMFPTAERMALASRLELVRLRSGQLLFDAGQRMTHAFFPTTAVVSMLSLMEDGATMEIAAIGNEGLVGVPLVMGGDTTLSRIEVRGTGFAYRICARDLKKEFADSQVMHRITLLYVSALLTQISQAAVCNRHHTLNKQLCRWLLLTLDRLRSNEMFVTQQSIANMLGVRREGVTEAAGRLEDAGIISHMRGQITVLDRAALEARTCECYGMVKREFERLLPETDVRAA